MLYPYTNLQELNLDWVLQKVKTIEEAYGNIPEEVAEALAQIESAKNDGLDAISAALTNAITVIGNAITAGQTAIESTKNQAVSAVTDAKNAGIDAIQAETATGRESLVYYYQSASSDISAQKTAALADIQSALQAALAEILAKKAQIDTQIASLAETLPENSAAILGELAILRGIVIGSTVDALTWFNGFYDDQMVLAVSTSYVTSTLQGGCAGRKLVLTPQTGYYVEMVQFWTIENQTYTYHSTPLYTITFPVNTALFAITVRRIDGEDMNVSEITNAISIVWPVSTMYYPNCLAYVEDNDTASKAHDIGEYFLLNNSLYITTAPIAIGDPIQASNAEIVPNGATTEIEKNANDIALLKNDVIVLTAATQEAEERINDANEQIGELNALCIKESVTTASGSMNVSAGTAIVSSTHLVDFVIPAGDTYKFTLTGAGLLSKYHLYANGSAVKYNCVLGTEYTLTAETDIRYLSIVCTGEQVTGTGTVTASVQAIHINNNSLEARVETLEGDMEQVDAALEGTREKLYALEGYCRGYIIESEEGTVNVYTTADTTSNTHLIDVSIESGESFNFVLNADGKCSKYTLYANGSAIKYNCVPETVYTLTAESNITWLSIYVDRTHVTSNGLVTGIVTLTTITSGSLQEQINDDKKQTEEVKSIINANVEFFAAEYEIGAYVNNDGNATYIYKQVSFDIGESDMVGILCDDVIGATSTFQFVVYHKNDSNSTIKTENFTKNMAKEGIKISPAEGAVKIAVSLYASTTGGLTTDTAKFKNVNVFTSNDGTFSIKNNSVPNPFPVPFYYLRYSYLQDKVDTIERLMKNANGNYDAFIFCTDQHWNQNAKQSPNLMNYICQRLNIPRMFMGGDYADGINLNALKAYRDGFTGKVYDVIGNHEYMNYFADIGKDFISKTIDGGDIWAYINMHMTDAVSGNYGRNYYFVDNEMQKMRYIILSVYADNGNSAVAQFETEQKNWLQNTALDLPFGYTAVVFAHYLYSVNYYTGEMAASSIAEEIEAIVDAYNGNAEIACLIAGHTHVDGMTTTSGGIPIFITTCDKYLPWIEGATNREPWLTENRHLGTTTEQAFDVVIIDKTNKLVSFVRIGAPADNGTGEKLEVRQQNY